MADIVAAGLVAPRLQRVPDGNVDQLTKVVEILIADDGKALLSGVHEALLVSRRYRFQLGGGYCPLRLSAVHNIPTPLNSCLFAIVKLRSTGLKNGVGR